MLIYKVESSTSPNRHPLGFPRAACSPAVHFPNAGNTCFATLERKAAMNVPSVRFSVKDGDASRHRASKGGF